MPTLSVIAGPNGSGKSTLTGTIWFEGNANLVDPDRIARALDASNPSRASIPAGRAAIISCRGFLAERLSFTLETTLSGHGATNIIRHAIKAGYAIFVVYIAAGDSDLHIERVRLRALQGGHNISDEDIRRRYTRSLNHAPEALTLADEGTVLDNSGLSPVRILLVQKGKIVWRGDNLPDWAHGICKALDSATHPVS